MTRPRSDAQFNAKAYEALNAHDADRFVALWTEDVVLDHSAAPTTLRGRAEVRAMAALQRLQSKLPRRR